MPLLKRVPRAEGKAAKCKRPKVQNAVPASLGFCSASALPHPGPHPGAPPSLNQTEPATTRQPPATDLETGGTGTLELSVTVVGLNFYGSEQPPPEPGTAVCLSRMSSNEVDRFAIQCCHEEGNCIGMIAWQHAKALAPLIDSGLKLISTTVKQQTNTSYIHLAVTVTVPEGETGLHTGRRDLAILTNHHVIAVLDASRGKAEDDFNISAEFGMSSWPPVRACAARWEPASGWQAPCPSHLLEDCGVPHATASMSPLTLQDVQQQQQQARTRVILSSE